MIDYKTMSFSKGIVCYNTNNFHKCVVIDGNQGSRNDRCSTVIEMASDRLFIHTPPNRALIPTGEYIDIQNLENVLSFSKNEYERVFGGEENE